MIEKIRRSSSNYLRQSFEFLVVILFLAFIVRSFLLTSYRVSSPVMMPRLLQGDFLVVSKSTYGMNVPFTGYQLGQRIPRRGEIIIFRSPEDESLHYVGRVMGVPGDRLEMRANMLSINNEQAQYYAVESRAFSNEGRMDVLEEQFSWGRFLVMLDSSKTQSFGPVIVPPGQIFVLGDYRQKSFDSRYFGSISQANIEGKVLGTWFSVDWLGNDGPHVRWQRALQFK